MALGQLAAELLGGIQGRIHLAAELLLTGADGRDQVRQGYVIADDKQIDVTRRPFCALRDRPKDEG